LGKNQEKSLKSITYLSQFYKKTGKKLGKKSENWENWENIQLTRVP